MAAVEDVIIIICVRTLRPDVSQTNPCHSLCCTTDPPLPPLCPCPVAITAQSSFSTGALLLLLLLLLWSWYLFCHIVQHPPTPPTPLSQLQLTSQSENTSLHPDLHFLLSSSDLVLSLPCRLSGRRTLCVNVDFLFFSFFDICCRAVIFLFVQR